MGATVIGENYVKRKTSIINITYMFVAALAQPLVRQSSDIQTHNIIVNLNCIMFGTGLSKKHIKTARFQGISNFLKRKQQGQ